MPTNKQHYKILRLILGDQLNGQHSWFDETRDDVLYVIAELRQETDYVKHHVQKICAFFAAMAEFATRLKADGHQVLYLDLDDSSDYPSLHDLIQGLCQRHAIARFEYQRPDEYRLLKQLRQCDPGSDVSKQEWDSEHFLLDFDEIPKEFEAGKAQRMEGFYRRMRRRHQLLMEGDKPAGEQWNFDKDNRQKLQPEDLEKLPEPLEFNNDVEKILARLQRHEVEYFGKTTKQLLWPVNREQARKLLRYFCAHCLANFGRFQDAMSVDASQRWSLYHSRLAFAMNSKLLSPAEVMDQAIAQYHKDDAIDLAQIEGFVRQILGWREFIRGIYWINMPDYAERNHFEARRPLPEFYWTADTGMRCLRESIKQSLDYAYAHHIQRLMLTGNFALLTGLDPDAVDAWYLGIYIDALDWVELPNTRGMALFADGGLVGSKPYAAGGNYINKMSDYCGQCQYKVSRKSGPGSCPFNSLYWHFMNRHRSELAHNHRLRMLFGSWDRMDSAKQEAILDTAEKYLANLDEL